MKTTHKNTSKKHRCPRLLNSNPFKALGLISVVGSALLGSQAFAQNALTVNGAASDDTITLRDYTAPGDFIAELDDGVNPPQVITVVGISTTTVNGGDGSDTLDIADIGAIGGGVIFHGGGPTGIDTLIISDTAAVTSVEHTFANANEGSVNIDGSLITYTGLEPVMDNLSVANRLFTFTGGAETITLSNAGTLDMQINSTLGEVVDFTNPSSSLTVNAGTGDDVVLVSGLIGGVVYTFDGGAGFDSLSFASGTNTVNLTGTGVGSLSGINFTNFEALDAGAGIDTLNTNAATTLTGTSGQVTSNGVTVSNIEILGTSNGTLNGSAGADTITLTGANTGNAGGVAFSDVTSMNIAGGHSATLNTDTLNTNAAATMSGVYALTVGGVTVHHATITTNGVAVALTSRDNLVSSNGNLISLASSSIDLTANEAGFINAIGFSGISALDAGVGGGDTANTNAVATLTGVSGQVVSNGVTVSNLENVVSANGELNGSAGDDTISLGASGVSGYGVTLTGINVINGGLGDDVLDVTDVTSMGGVTFNGGGQTTGDSILISDTSAVTTVTHTFINANDGSINADGSTLNYTGLEPVVDNLSVANRVFTFTGGAETITLSNAGTLDMQIDSTLGEVVDFTNPSATLTVNAGTGADVVDIQSLDAGFSGTVTVDGGAALDSLSYDTGADTINLTGTGAGTISGISFTNFEALDPDAGSDTLNTNADTTLTGLGAVLTNGVTVSNLEILGTSNGTLNLTGSNDTVNLTGASTGNAGGVAFSDVTTMDAAGGSDTLNTNADTALTGTVGQVTSNGVTVSNLEILGTSNGTLNGSAVADAISLTGTNTGNAGGIAFSDVTTMDAAGGSDTLNTNADTTLTGTSGQVTSNGVTVSNLEVLGTSNGTLNGSAFADAITLTGASTGNAGGIAFSDVTAIDAAGGSDSVYTSGPAVLTGTTGQVTTNGVTVSNVEALNSMAGSLTTTAAADAITLSANNTGNAYGVDFSGFLTIDAAGGSDTLTTNADTTLTGFGSVLTNNVTVSNLENLVSTHGNLNGTAGNDLFNITAANAGDVAGVNFSGISTIDASTGTDTATSTDSIALTGVAGQVSTHGITLSNISGVSSTSPTFEGSSGADNITLTANNSITANGVTITTTSPQFTTINGNDGSDQLEVTDVTAMGGITYNGGGPSGSDSILISDTTTAVTNLRHTFINENDGSINADGAVLNYTGLEPVIDNVNAVNRQFQFSGGAETITLSTGGTLDMQIDSTLGEVVDFVNPTSVLEILGGAGNDSVNVTGVDAAFTGVLRVQGQAGNLDLQNLLSGNSAQVLITADAGGAITDSGDIEISGLLQIGPGGNTGDVTLGGAGETTNFGKLRILTQGDVVIQEDSATNLILTNSANSLTLTSTGGTNIGTGGVTTTGEQVYNSAVTLTTGNVVLSAGDTDADGEGIDFNSTVTGGGNNLTVTGGAGFAGAASGIGALMADHIDTESTLGAASVNVTGTSDLGGTVTTTGDQTYTGPVALTADVELDGDNVNTAAVDAGGNTLTLDGASSVATGAITNGNLITQSSATVASADLGTLDVQAGTTTVSGNLAASGSVTNAATLNISGAGNTAGSYVSNAGTLAGTGTLTAGSYDLNTGSTVDANLGNGNIEADGTVAINGNTGTGPLNVNTGTTTTGAASNIGGSVVVDPGAALTHQGAIAGNLDNDGTTGNTGSVAGSTDNSGNLTNNGTGTLNGNVTNSGTLTTDTDGIANTANLTNNAPGTVSLTGTDTINNLANSGTLNGNGVWTVNGTYMETGTLGTALTRTVAGMVVTKGVTLRIDSSAGGIVTLGAGSTLDISAPVPATAPEFGERYNVITVDPNVDHQIVSTVGGGIIGFSAFNIGTLPADSILFDISTGDVVSLGAPIILPGSGAKAVNIGGAVAGGAGSVNQRAIFNAVVAGAVDTVGNFDGNDNALGAILSNVLADQSTLAGLNSLSPEAYAGVVDYATQATRHYSEAARLGHGHALTSGNYQLTAGYSGFSMGSGKSVDDGDYDLEGQAGFVALRFQPENNGRVNYGAYLGMDEGEISGSFLNLDTEGYVLGAFADYNFDYDGRKWNLWGSVAYGDYEYDGTRRVALKTVTHTHMVDSIEASTLELGVGVNVESYANNGFSVKPGLGFRFLHTDVSDFSETSGGFSALNVNGMDYTSLLLDARVDFSFQPEGERYGVNGHIGWQHNFANSSRDVTAQFQSGGSAFTVVSPGLDSDALTYGIGGYYDVTENMRINLQYRGENRANDNGYGVDLRFTIGF